jgi:hypothetical protein
MRCACVAWLIAGCGFTTGPIPTGDPDLDPGDPPVVAPPVAARCDASDPATDPSLHLCVTFDQDPMVDLASPPNAIAELAGLTVVQLADERVARLGTKSQIRFAEATDLDVTDLTIDLWIGPARISRDHSYWLFDNNTQYAAWYDEDERVNCQIGDQIVTSAQSFREGWHHVACRYDADANELRIYLDGSVSGCTAVPDGIPTGGNDGLAIGANYDAGYRDQFVGQLDSFHLYSRALPSADICRAARRSDCRASCEGEGESDGD